MTFPKGSTLYSPWDRPVPPPLLDLPMPTEDALLTMRILARVQNYLPYGSEIWQDVMKARGLDPRPRSMK